MDLTNVTFACDDETNLKHTKVFFNKNLFQCYHHNRGYCSFKERCRYQHYRDICTENVCRDSKCAKRHPVICRYKDECKFYKINNCAFKHIEMEKDVASKDLENEIKTLIDDIKRLKTEITDSNDINIKEKELSESRLEIQQLKHENQQEKETIKNETDDLKNK